jgi:hypothetical protein
MRDSIHGGGLADDSGEVNNQRLLQIVKPHCFFAHIAFATDARVRATVKATANLLIEINDIALTSGAKEKHLNVSTLTKPQKVELAGGIARAAARDYLKLERAFRKFPVQQFVDFNLAATPTYISIRPPPTKVFPNGSKIWRLAESESDKLRTKPLSVPSKEAKARSAPRHAHSAK